MMQEGFLPQHWSLDTTAGLATLNGEVTRQAATIAYLNDFQFMMWVTLAAVPLLVFLRRPARQAAPPAGHAVMD
jgi:DHA2 family multidrug resistance protein